VILTVIFDRYAYQIDAFDARIRLALTAGSTDIRNFDTNGLPISYSASTGRKFISPFYVVHYGLMYSNNLVKRSERVGPEWFEDKSVAYWNLPPKVYKQNYFKNCADWVVSHISKSYGQAHLIYDFDWRYRNYPNGGLKAPWWSGLTDGYAIILLLRAHDVYGDARYLQAASELYSSVLTPIAEGGSLNQFHGHPWIEEYVDPNANPADMSFVLNGMIYATYGVEVYEKYTSVREPQSAKLYQSIDDNLQSYDRGYWSEYDAIGNATNIKYQRVHVALLERISEITGDERIKRIRNRWEFGVENAGFFWILNSHWGYSQWQFILEYLLLILLPLFLAFLLCCRKVKKVVLLEGRKEA